MQSSYSKLIYNGENSSENRTLGLQSFENSPIQLNKSNFLINNQRELNNSLQKSPKRNQKNDPFNDKLIKENLLYNNQAVGRDDNIFNKSNLSIEKISKKKKFSVYNNKIELFSQSAGIK